MDNIDSLLPVGKVTGPGDNNNQIKIQTLDNQHTKVGEYLVYMVYIDGIEYQVFCTICDRKIVRNLPTTYMAHPMVSGCDVAEALGLDGIHDEIQYEISANILGYFDSALGSFINPRINPDPDTTVYLVSDSILQEALFSRSNSDVGAAWIGELLLRRGVPVVLNVDEMVNTHFSILAGTGSGKSYLARVIIEELMMPRNQASICIFDPHGEYITFGDESGVNSACLTRLDVFRGESYQPNVKVLIPGMNLTFSIHELSFSEICFLLPTLTEKMKNILEKLVDIVYKKTPKHEWTYSDLMRELGMFIDEAQNGEREHSLSTLQGLYWRLESRFGQKRSKAPVFVDRGGTCLQDIYQPGLCTVLDLSGLEEDEQQIICALILNKVYDARLKAKNGDTMKNDKDDLEHPVFNLIEEAHRFCPQGDPSSISTRILKRILAEGRKFGIGVGLITQRPGKLDQNILSQCMTQFLMRIINPIDQESVKQGVESAGRELLDELPSLSKGQAIVTGVAVRVPALVKVRRAYTKHGGNSASPSSEWIEANSQSRCDSRDSRNAVLGQTSTRKKPWEM